MPSKLHKSESFTSGCGRMAFVRPVSPSSPPPSPRSTVACWEDTGEWPGAWGLSGAAKPAIGEAFPPDPELQFCPDGNVSCLVVRTAVPVVWSHTHWVVSPGPEQVGGCSLFVLSPRRCVSSCFCYHSVRTLGYRVRPGCVRKWFWKGVVCALLLRPALLGLDLWLSSGGHHSLNHPSPNRSPWSWEPDMEADRVTSICLTLFLTSVSAELGGKEGCHHPLPNLSAQYRSVSDQPCSSQRGHSWAWVVRQACCTARSGSAPWESGWSHRIHLGSHYWVPSVGQVLSWRLLGDKNCTNQ